MFLSACLFYFTLILLRKLKLQNYRVEAKVLGHLEKYICDEICFLCDCFP